MPGARGIRSGLSIPPCCNKVSQGRHWGVPDSTIFWKNEPTLRSLDGFSCIMPILDFLECEGNWFCGHAKVCCHTKVGTIPVDYVSQMGSMPICSVVVVDAGSLAMDSLLPQGSKFIFGPQSHRLLIQTDLQALNFLHQKSDCSPGTHIPASSYPYPTSSVSFVTRDVRSANIAVNHIADLHHVYNNTLKKQK